jgi:uncharacterized RDD family membrane protein YckC
MTAGAGPLEPAASGLPVAPGQPAVPAEPAAVGEVQLTVEPGVRYVGLATRVISFVIDAALVNLVAVVVGVGASLILSLLRLPGPLKTILAAVGGVAYILWSVGYFIVFWSTTGQTPGARVMQIRVVSTDGGRLKPHRALVRCAGVLLAALPLFAGFALILFDDKRRGFQDRFAGTLVVEASQMSLFEARAAAKRAAYAASRQPPVPPG